MFKTIKLKCAMRTILRRMYHASKHTVEIPDTSVTDYIFRRIGNHGQKVALVSHSENHVQN